MNLSPGTDMRVTTAATVATIPVAWCGGYFVADGAFLPGLLFLAVGFALALFSMVGRSRSQRADAAVAELWDALRTPDVQAALRTVLLTAPARNPAPAPQPLYEDADAKRDLPAGLPGVLAVYGPPRSGKDVIADYVVANFNGVGRLAFSDVILLEVNAFLARFPVATATGTRTHVITAGNKSEPMYRKLLQEWGLQSDKHEPGYWGRQVKRVIAARQAEGARLVIITGVRLLPDVELVESVNGRLLRVERPGNDYSAAHAVEASLEDLDPNRYVTVLNPAEGDLRPYEANIEATLADLAGGSAKPQGDSSV